MHQIYNFEVLTDVLCLCEVGLICLHKFGNRSIHITHLVSILVLSASPRDPINTAARSAGNIVKIVLIQHISEALDVPVALVELTTAVNRTQLIEQCLAFDQC